MRLKGSKLLDFSVFQEREILLLQARNGLIVPGHDYIHDDETGVGVKGRGGVGRGLFF
jgi:hypothetical protein